MCGRFTRLYSWKQLHRLLGLTSAPLPGLAPSYNVAPSQQSCVCRLSSRGERELVAMRWGLTPAWSRDGRPGPVNARRETVATSRMFRGAFALRRCIVPVSGFYEWRRLGAPNGKQPYYIHAADDEPLLLAGLWESWGRHDRSIESFTIITTEPNAMIAAIHDRAPVILDPHQTDLWLDPSAPVEALLPLLRPAPNGTLLMRRVSTRVNKPEADGPTLLEDPGNQSQEGQATLFGN